MIFKTLFRGIWRVFDVLCFVGALVILNITMWCLGTTWGGITLAITLALIGWLSEMIPAKGGDN